MSRSRVRGVRETPVLDVVVDASTAVRWYVPEPESRVASRLLEGGWRLNAPDFMPVDATNAWWKKVRRGERTRHQMEESVGLLLSVGINWVPVREILPRAARLSIELSHPVYDCVYLATAQALSAVLAAGDKRLRDLAQQLDVPVYPATLKGRA